MASELGTPLLESVTDLGQLYDHDSITVERTNAPKDPNSPPAQPGQKVSMHYRGTVTYADGKPKMFDTSIGRGPFEFTLGIGQVIKGWDQGLIGMRVGEKRLLVIQPDWAYGGKAVGPTIKANSVLTFETELLQIRGNPIKLASLDSNQQRDL